MKKYKAYLLRIWQAENTGWRATLEDAHSRKQVAFSSLAHLFEYLESETEQASPAGKEQGDDLAQQEI